jgi:pimeloyl-ACP methyl ester carboxylesterase
MKFEWINEIANTFKLDKFYVMGVSNGAAITYKYTLHESERVIKAVCVEGGIITKPLKSMVCTLLLLFPEILIPTKKNMIKAMSKLVSPDSNIYAKHPEVIDHIIMVEKVHNKSAMFPHKLEKYDKEMALKVKDKLYFILGDYMVESSKSRQEYVELLNEVGFKYDVIKNAGHAVNHEQPEIVNEKIIAFLN